MKNTENQEETWRSDHGLVSSRVYKRRFAIFPVVCEDGKRIWLKSYYKKYTIWGHDRLNDFLKDDDYRHTDFDGNITEEEYIVRKLSETL